MDFRVIIVFLNFLSLNLAIVDIKEPRRTSRLARPQRLPILERRQLRQFSHLNIQPQRAGEISLECLDCICQASTGCSTNVPCRQEGEQGSLTTLCGPFFISYYYWSDAGKPGSNATVDDFVNFETCVLQRPCADQAVRGYMLRYSKDCDGDGQITCLDYALIHKAGPSGCLKGQVQDSKYGKLFDQCIANPLPAIDPRKKVGLTPR